MRSFRQDEEGSVLIIAGLMALVLFAVMGMSVDLGRQQMVRLKLQQATDAAALAAALLPSDATNRDRQQVAQRYYNLNFPDTYLGVLRPPATITIGTNVDVSATTQIATRFVSNVGYRDMTANGHSVVALGGQQATDYDVILVMDNSNSMAQVITGGVSNFKDSGAQLSDAHNRAVSECKLTYDIMQMGVTYHDAYVSECYKITGDAAKCEAFFSQTGQPAAKRLTDYFKDAVCEFGKDQAGKSDGSLASATDGAPHTPVIYYGIGPNQPSRINAVRAAASTFVSQVLAASSGSKVGLVRYAGDVDATSGTLGLTLQQQDLQQFISLMSAVNGTNGLKAMKRTSDLANQFDNTHVRSVVLLTDGRNTQAADLRYIPSSGTLNDGTPNGGCNGSSYCPYSTQEALRECTNLKNKGVLIYTIAYSDTINNGGPEEADADSFLTQCATLNNDTYVKRASNASDLNAAFSEILTQLGKVRIVQ